MYTLCKLYFLIQCYYWLYLPHDTNKYTVGLNTSQYISLCSLWIVLSARIEPRSSRITFRQMSISSYSVLNPLTHPSPTNLQVHNQYNLPLCIVNFLQYILKHKNILLTFEAKSNLGSFWYMKYKQYSKMWRDIYS